jgi:hypothetical protein
MIHHDDSMFLKLTLLNNHNKEALQHQANTLPRARLSDTDNLRICKNHRVPLRPLEERQAMGNKSMATHKACSMVYSRAPCSTVKISQPRNRSDNQRRRTNSMECTAWRSQRLDSRHMSRFHSTDRVQIHPLRPTAPHLGCHNRRNTTWEIIQDKPAHLRLNSPHSQSLHSICCQIHTLNQDPQAANPTVAP